MMSNDRSIEELDLLLEQNAERWEKLHSEIEANEAEGLRLQKLRDAAAENVSLVA